VKIFVSYSRRDAGDFANQIQRHLSSFKYDIFTDVDSIRAGEIWSNTITTNISNCDIFVIIVTYGSLHSEHVEREVQQAQKENKKIIPCFFRGINPDKIKWGLEKIQGVEFTNEYQLARDLYSKIDIETGISRDSSTESSISKKPDIKNNTITPLTQSDVDELVQKKDTVSTFPKVIKDDTPSKPFRNIEPPLATSTEREEKEQKDKRNQNVKDSFDKSHQTIFGSVTSKPIEETRKTDLPTTNIDTARIPS